MVPLYYLCRAPTAEFKAEWLLGAIRFARGATGELAWVMGSLPGWLAAIVFVSFVGFNLLEANAAVAG